MGGGVGGWVGEWVGGWEANYTIYHDAINFLRFNVPLNFFPHMSDDARIQCSID